MPKEEQNNPIDEEKELDKILSSVGWAVIFDKMQKRKHELTNLEDIDENDSAENVKATLIGMKKARDIVSTILAEFSAKHEYYKKKRIDYS